MVAGVLLIAQVKIVGLMVAVGHVVLVYPQTVALTGCVLNHLARMIVLMGVFSVLALHHIKHVVTVTQTIAMSGAQRLLVVLDKCVWMAFAQIKRHRNRAENV